MKKKIRYGVLCGALLLGCFMTSPIGANEVAANSEKISLNTYAVATFKDVSPKHYAYDAVNWAKAKGIVAGYTTNGKPNGLFGPDDVVTEAQFVKMVAQYLGLKDDAGDISKARYSKTHWSDTYYDALAKYEVPLRGYLHNDDRNTPALRGTVAEALGYLIGNQTDLKSSIQYLIDNGISNGQYPQYEKTDLHEYFGSANKLTRAQVVTFLHRMERQGLKQLSANAVKASKSSEEIKFKAYNSHIKADRTFDKIEGLDYSNKAYLDYLQNGGMSVYGQVTPIYIIYGVNAEYGGTLFSD